MVIKLSPMVLYYIILCICQFFSYFSNKIKQYTDKTNHKPKKNDDQEDQRLFK